MGQKLMTTLLILIFLVLVIAGLEALSISQGGAQEISQSLSCLTVRVGMSLL